MPLLVLPKLSYAFATMGYYKNVEGSIASDFPGERYNLMTGQLSFQYRDVHLPSNGLDISLDRKFDNSTPFGDAGLYNLQISMGWHWSLDIPRMLVYSNLFDGEGCLNAQYINIAMAGQIIGRSVGYENISDLPVGYDNKDIAFSNGSVYDCSNKTLKLPTGESIVLDKFSKTSWFGVEAAMYYPSKITDRFGNEINFTYENGWEAGPNNQLILTRVTSSDGGVANIHYQDMVSNDFKKIDKITYGEGDSIRTVNYNYKPGTDYLSEVIDPEGRKTTYNWRTDTDSWIEYSQSKSVTYENISEVTMPKGVKIVYDYLNGRDARDPASCNLVMQCAMRSSVKRKEITGANIEPLYVNYLRKHHEESGSENGDVVVSEYRSKFPNLSLINPAQKLNIYRFHRERYLAESGDYVLTGMLKEFRIYKGRETQGIPRDGSPTYLLNYKMETDWDYREKGKFGCKRIYFNNLERCFEAYMTKQTRTYYEGNGSMSYMVDFLERDQYNRVTNYREYANSLQDSSRRFVLRRYRDDRDNWLLNLPTTAYYSDGHTSYTSVSNQEYYASNHASYPSLPSSHYKFGLLQHTDTEYNTAGQLKKRVSNVSQNYEIYDNYSQGIPEITKTKNRYNSALVDTMTRVIDVFGNVQSETDYEGNAISYEYDNLNRLTKVDYVGPSWADISYDYYFENGLEVKKKTHGNLVSYEYYNARGQVYKTNVNGVSQDFTYYNDGQLKTKTLPYYSTNTSPKYIGYTYDALDRKTMETLSGGYLRTWQYPPSKIKYTDGYGNQTTTTYLGRGDVDYSMPTYIQSPENVITEIDYDVFDLVSSVKQGNSAEGFVEKSYLYNDNKLLCRTLRPETNTTQYVYNAGGQLKSKVTGILSFYQPGLIGRCDEFSGGGKRVNFTYDYRGGIHQTKLASTIYSTTTLDKVGNIESLITPAGTWSYMYNDRNLLDLETFTIDGSNYSLDWGYNNQGYVSSLTYPSNNVVSFGPDELGRPTNVGSYVNNVRYSAAGNLTTLSYGNGVVRNYQDNDLGLTELINYTPSIGAPVTRSYQYDNELNWSYISRVPSGMSGNDYISNIQYDGLQRIKSANSYVPLGIQHTFNYDANNNIEFISDGWESRDLHYDSKNRVSSYDHVNSAGVTSTFALAYDERGNITNDGTNSYQYNLLNEMIQGGGWNFSYDGNGLLVKKYKGEEAIYSIYSQSGMLMHQKVGDVKTDFMYVGDTLVAKEMKK